MPSTPRLLAGALAAVLAAAGLTAPGAAAQNAATVRVLQDLIDEVKLADGSTARWRIVTTYDPASGETVRTVTDEAGRLVERTTRVGTLAAPTPVEVAEAEALVRADAEVAALIAGAEQPVVQGGFVLLREEGHVCGPGSRCLQFDVVNVDEAARRVERLRYVVVDLRAGRIVSNDFDPAAEGNSVNPLHQQ